MKSKLVAAGSYLPNTIVANSDLSQFPAAVQKIIQIKTGIECRRHAAQEEAVSEMGALAAKYRLEQSGRGAGDIDCIICLLLRLSGYSQRWPLPIQEKIGARNAFAFDINSVCSGCVKGILG
jgi:3-oxoacyl-[acyl-carrier-protein] synthase III